MLLGPQQVLLRLQTCVIGASNRYCWGPQLTPNTVIQKTISMMTSFGKNSVLQVNCSEL
jgi:hypothetical protein